MFCVCKKAKFLKWENDGKQLPGENHRELRKADGRIVLRAAAARTSDSENVFPNLPRNEISPLLFGSVRALFRAGGAEFLHP